MAFTRSRPFLRAGLLLQLMLLLPQLLLFALELVLDPSIEIDKDAVVIGRVVGGSAQLAELTTEISDAGPAALGEVRVLSWSPVADDDAQHANA